QAQAPGHGAEARRRGCAAGPLPHRVEGRPRDRVAQPRRGLHRRRRGRSRRPQGVGVREPDIGKPFGGSPAAGAARVSLEKAPDLPHYWNVPYPRSPLFTGRADDFDRLKQHFARRMPHTPVQAIHGLGGIGKTQLALEYAYRYAGDYNVVWWLRAEDPATLAADLADLAVELRLPGSVEPDQRAAIGAVKHWLAHNDRWLLVFDSARDPRDVADYIPPPVTGHILITSRYSSWAAVAWPLQLRGL